MYYLQSRYYDPEIGRFLNADALASTGQGILGNNMFAYCGNTLVNVSDPAGTAMIACDPLRGGPVGAGSIAGIDNSFSPGPNDSLTKKLRNLFNNEDESIVTTAQRFSFYKGVPVIKVPGDAGFSFGFIFLGNDIIDPNLVRHEYGHIRQLEELCVANYLTFVVCPSVICFGLTEAEQLSWSTYYSYPWEYTADQYGGASHTYTSWADSASNVYWTAINVLVGLKSYLIP